MRGGMRVRPITYKTRLESREIGMAVNSSEGGGSGRNMVEKGRQLSSRLGLSFAKLFICSALSCVCLVLSYRLEIIFDV